MMTTTVATAVKTSPASTASAGRSSAPPLSRGVWRRILATVALAAAVLTFHGFALGQEFVKVDDAAREQLPATPFVGLAYGFIWVAILGYLFIVARGLARLKDELRDLRRRIDRAGGAGSGTP